MIISQMASKAHGKVLHFRSHLGSGNKAPACSPFTVAALKRQIPRAGEDTEHLELLPAGGQAAWWKTRKTPSTYLTEIRTCRPYQDTGSPPFTGLHYSHPTAQAVGWTNWNPAIQGLLQSNKNDPPQPRQ